MAITKPDAGRVAELLQKGADPNFELPEANYTNGEVREEQPFTPLRLLIADCIGCYPAKVGNRLLISFVFLGLISGSSCSEEAVVDTNCGDETVDDGEVCDDGNIVGGDGCAANCLSDETCGNGYLDDVDVAEPEECDDGNLVGGDGCNADCTIDPDTLPPPTSFSDVWPIFMSNCATCHTTSASGSLQIGNSVIETAYTSSQQDAYSSAGTKGEASLVRILNGSMPQGRGCNPPMTDGTEGCPDAEDRALIQKWIDDGQLGPQ